MSLAEFQLNRVPSGPCLAPGPLLEDRAQPRLKPLLSVEVSFSGSPGVGYLLGQVSDLLELQQVMVPMTLAGRGL